MAVAVMINYYLIVLENGGSEGTSSVSAQGGENNFEHLQGKVFGTLQPPLSAPWPLLVAQTILPYR